MKRLRLISELPSGWCLVLVVVATLGGAPAAHAKRGAKGPGAKTTGASKAQPAGDGGGRAAAPAAANTDKKTVVAILPLASMGLDSETKASLERYLHNSIDTIENIDVVAQVDLQMALRRPKNKAAAECGGGAKCAAQVGRLVQADVAVFGSLGALGDAFSLNLRAIDVATGNEIARQRTNLSGTRHLLIPEMRLAAYRLIAPDRIRGSLLIEIDVEGVEVEIDGAHVGTTPLNDPVSLAPGAHVVVLKRPGYSQFQREFEIKPFDTARLELNLKSAEEAAAPAR